MRLFGRVEAWEVYFGGFLPISVTNNTNLSIHGLQMAKLAHLFWVFYETCSTKCAITLLSCKMVPSYNYLVRTRSFGQNLINNSKHCSIDAC